MLTHITRQAAALTLFLFSCCSWAQAIDVTIPYAANGSSDLMTRRLVRNMAMNLGQPVVMNNRPGANGLVALRSFVESAQSRPGYLLVGSPTFLAAAVNEPALLEQVRPVALVGMAPLVIVKPAGREAFDESVLNAARKKGSLDMAISAQGSISHLCAAQLAQAIGVPLKPMLYKGTAPLLVDLMARQLDYACLEVQSVVPHMKTDRLAVVAAAGDEATDILPNVPSLSNFKIQGVTRGLWYVMMAPAGAPADQTAAFAVALQKALIVEATDPSRRETGFQVIPPEAATEAAATAFIQREYARMKPFLSMFRQ